MENELIIKAKDRNTDWQDISVLIDSTDDVEIKNELHRIMMAKYHKEEYYSGLL